MVTDCLHLQDPHRHRSTQKLPIRTRLRLFFSAIVSAVLQDEIAIKPSARAAASLGTNGRGAIVVSSSEADATFEFLIGLKPLKVFKVLYILLCVEKESVDGKIKDKTTQKRVLQSLSENKTAILDIKDLYKLDGFFGWSWEDIQRKLEKIKAEVKFILYVKQNGQLVEAIKALHIDHIYLVGDIECDTVEANPPPGCKCRRLGTLSIDEKDCVGGPPSKHINGPQS